MNEGNFYRLPKKELGDIIERFDEFKVFHILYI